ncbi:MAG: radical SAM protein [Candidatus Aminicenantes bacterium]|nr:radical SAM protein [Candidatus Aminicenantes bacterium]
MQELSSLTLVLTDKCNFSCPYCPQHRGKKTLKIEAIKDFLDYLKPRLAEEVWLGFYGGEPLLAWPLVEKTVEHLQKSRKTKFHFTLTSNGSLLKKEQIVFFKENKFELVLSYDGLAQAKRDPGSVVAVEKALADLKKNYPEGYTINSVFTPATVSMLSASIEILMGQGHRNLQYSLDLSVPWQDFDLMVLQRELNRLAGRCLEVQNKTGRMTLENFKDSGKKGIFACFAGRDRLALLPDNTVWGCYLFYDLLGHRPDHPDYKKYCFGKMPAFKKDKARNDAVASNYRDLRQDYFFTETKELCSLCDKLENCSVCPVVAALATSELGLIPTWTCRLKALQTRFKAQWTAIH